MTVAEDVPGPLRGLVSSFVDYDVEVGAPGTHLGLPSTALTLVLPLGRPLDVDWESRPGTRQRSWASVSGLHDGPARIHHDGHQRGVQLSLTPRGARALLGVPAAALRGHLLDLGDVDPALRHLPEQLATTDPVERRAHVVRELVRARARHETAPTLRAPVARALELLRRGATVADVARDVGYSRRHLATLLHAEIGVAPKTWARLARLERSHDAVRRQAVRGRLDLARVAAETGHADQAHLSREWRDLVGRSPTAWLREELPFVQDAAADQGQDGRHD